MIGNLSFSVSRALLGFAGDHGIAKFMFVELKELCC
jgi:hypothetical protein